MGRKAPYLPRQSKRKAPGAKVPSMLTDSHCHLDQLPDPAAALEKAAENGVGRVVAVSEDEASGRKNLELKERFPETVHLGLGFHPMLTPTREPAEVERCLDFLAEHLEGAEQLGEVGLDFKWARSEEEQSYQRQILDRQLELAARHRKPINLHSRWALRQTLEVAVDFTRETGLGAQMHWFTQSKKLIRISNPARVYVSVGPSILFDEQARGVAALIERDLLLLETDSPVPFDGNPAEPSWIQEVARMVAQLWSCDPAEVARQTELNYRRFLGGETFSPTEG